MKPSSVVVLLGLSGAACGPKAGTPSETMTHTDDSKALGQPCADRMLGMPAATESTFGPLEVGADLAGYHKVSTEPFLSRTHGGRFVEVYVNDVAFQAYTRDEAFPVGSVIVKTSWENEGGRPAVTPGPIFTMKKEAQGYLPDHEDWNYGIHWEKPTAAQLTFLKGPIYWRGKSPRVEYCWKCHDNYDRAVGGIPTGKRSWERE